MSDGKIVTLSDLVQELNMKKLADGHTKAFKMDFSYIPSKEKSIVKLAGHSILSTGNISIMIAPPGSGKSNVVEAIAAGGVNPECDSLGFDVDSEKTLLIDTERVLNDVARGLRRIKSRCGKEDEEILKRLDIFSFLDLDNITEAKTELEFILTHGGYELVILDGSADFVTSVNDEAESKSFWKWIVKLANNLSFGVLMTIHPNPEDPTGKATGHLGSQGQKKAESVFNIFKAKDDKRIREITTNTPHGKVRNAPDGLFSSFTWNDEEKMFISCDYKPRKNVKGIDAIFERIFEKKEAFAYNELRLAHMEATGKSDSTAKRDIKTAEELEIIFKNSGMYWLNNSHSHELVQANEERKKEQEPEIPF